MFLEPSKRFPHTRERCPSVSLAEMPSFWEGFADFSVLLTSAKIGPGGGWKAGEKPQAAAAAAAADLQKPGIENSAFLHLHSALEILRSVQPRPPVCLGSSARRLHKLVLCRSPTWTRHDDDNPFSLGHSAAHSAAASFRFCPLLVRCALTHTGFIRFPSTGRRCNCIAVPCHSRQAVYSKHTCFAHTHAHGCGQRGTLEFHVEGGRHSKVVADLSYTLARCWRRDKVGEASARGATLPTCRSERFGFRLLQRKRRVDVLGRILVHLEVEARDGQIEVAAHELGLQVERMVVVLNRPRHFAPELDSVAPSRLYSSQSSRTHRERSGETVDRLVVVLARVEDDAERDLDVGIDLARSRQPLLHHGDQQLGQPRVLFRTEAEVLCDDTLSLRSRPVAAVARASSASAR
ncbi:hypothetical protein L1887_55055 [Cichorium endivia]|nr:hypothetical protein L1887_55055 [Cichorium endivia]